MFMNLMIVIKLSNVFWSETHYSKADAQLTVKSFVGIAAPVRD